MPSCSQCGVTERTSPRIDLRFADLFPDGNIHGFFDRSEIHAERYPGGSVTFPSVHVFRCPSCGVLWIEQYEEIMTPDRMFEEWGYRCHRIAPLTEDDLAEIERTIAAGSTLPSDRFFAPRPATEVPQQAPGDTSSAEEKDSIWSSIAMFLTFAASLVGVKLLISWLFARYIW